MHPISSSGSRALALLAAVLVTALLAAACGGDGDETAEADATTTTTTAEDASESPTSAPESGAPEEFPTIDVDAALQGVDTETPPDPRFCEISGFVNSAEFEAVLLAALGGDEEARAQFEELFEEFESVAPEDLKDDVAALHEGLVLSLEVTQEAVESDGMVDQTQLQEDLGEIVGDSGARLGAYDQIVCGNATPGEALS